MFLTPEIIAIYILNALFLVFGFFAFIISIKIVKSWDISLTSPTQYKLEKEAILASTIIKYIFILKIPLFLFFIFTSDKVSAVLTGAMCAAGVVNSVGFGMWLVVFKIVNLFIFGFWLALHATDMKDEKLSLTKLKFYIFIPAFFLLVAEILYEVLFFSSLDITRIVSCCGAIFSAALSSSIPFVFTLSQSTTIVAFYLSFLLLLLGWFLKKEALFLFANILFFIVALFSLILFFGTYIYELPTHKCPFCFLQKDYYFIGYLLYITLFMGTLSGVNGSVLTIIKPNYSQSFYKTSLIFISIYTFIVSVYPVLFYIKNGVWL